MQGLLQNYSVGVATAPSPSRTEPQSEAARFGAYI